MKKILDRLKVSFIELDESVKSKYLHEFVMRIFLVFISIVLCFFISFEISSFMLFLSLLYLGLSIYSLLLFLFNKVECIDAEYLGVWEGSSILQKARNLFITKIAKKQNVLYLKKDGEYFLVTVNKIPPLIIGSSLRIYFVPQAKYKGNDGIYRISGILHLYSLIE